MLPKRIVIVGATSTIAEHCARLWMGNGATDLTLVGRDAARTERVAADLRTRAPSARVDVALVDFDDAAAIRTLVDRLAQRGAFDLVLIAHGSLPDQSLCQRDLIANRTALLVNAVSPVLFAEAFAGHMEQAATGRLGIIGSVAGDRGRRSNYVYGAAKGLVGRYAQGLQHRLAGKGVFVTLIKPGPTRTPMTSHLPGHASMTSPEAVAAIIVRSMERGAPVVYAPAKWALIMQVIRHLPAFVFNRLDL